jgi:hypothetical protein
LDEAEDPIEDGLLRVDGLCVFQQISTVLDGFDLGLSLVAADHHLRSNAAYHDNGERSHPHLAGLKTSVGLEDVGLNLWLLHDVNLAVLTGALARAG